MEIVVNVLSLYKTPNKNMSVCLQAPLHLIGGGWRLLTRKKYVMPGCRASVETGIQTVSI